MTSQGLNILLVEDNEDDVLLIRESFAMTRLPYRLYVVRDGAEAMDFLRLQGRHKEAARPQIVLLDINMPIKDGFEVLMEIKADMSLRNLPVVFLTTSDREADIERAFAEGAASYITKPAKFYDIQTVLKQFLLYWSSIARLPAIRDGSRREWVS